AGDKEINRPACSVYSDHKAKHQEGCLCFRPEKIEGWIDEMGEQYSN
ncbi:20752_t:CDS:1, partial [Gigaspora rosea]